MAFKQWEDDSSFETIAIQPKVRAPIIHECFICGDNTANLAALRAHVQSSAERPRWKHKCFYCGDEFQSNRALITHLQHCNEKPNVA
jgi:hypothetical protein